MSLQAHDSLLAPAPPTSPATDRRQVEADWGGLLRCLPDRLAPLPLAERVVLLAVPAAARCRASEFLTAAGATVDVVPDVASLRRSAERVGPAALVVADVRHGGRPLQSALSELSRQDAVVLMLDQSSDSSLMGLLRAGADHVARCGAWSDVVTLLSTVLRRSTWPDPGRVVLRAGDITVDTSRRTAQCGERRLHLTALEFDLLAYFVRHPETALSRRTLLAAVWGYDVGGLDTVTVHLRRLRTKLELEPSHPRYLQTVWGVGYKLDPSPDGQGAPASESAAER
jgi:DNA-binding response OmpR family regulator